MSLEQTDLEHLIPNSSDNSPSTDLFVAYQDGRGPATIGPIVLTTPKHYTASELPNVNPNATCWEILTLRLGRFARQYVEKHGGGSVTDAMLQTEARRILYEDPDDTWNQTAADNPEWLNLFKKAHGIETKLPVLGTYMRRALYQSVPVAFERMLILPRDHFTTRSVRGSWHPS